MELWKDVDWIDGYAGVMEVSNTGMVRRHSYEYVAMGRWKKPHKGRKRDQILSPFVGKNGYAQIAVMLSGKRKKFLVHRLVGRAFVSGYAEGLTINHINGVKTDNRSDNLEWVTKARNTQHAWETGLVDLRGDAHPSRRLNSGKVRIIRDLLNMGATPNSLSVLLDVSPSTLYLIRDGKR